MLTHVPLSGTMLDPYAVFMPLPPHSLLLQTSVLSRLHPKLRASLVASSFTVHRRAPTALQKASASLYVTAPLQVPFTILLLHTVSSGPRAVEDQPISSQVEVEESLYHQKPFKIANKKEDKSNKKVHDESISYVDSSSRKTIISFLIVKY